MTVYLLHLSTPLGNGRHKARHYIGCTNNISRRLAEHRSGGAHSAAILRAANARGITYQLARTWDGGRALEKQLKAWKKSRQLCPICQEQEHSHRDG